MISKIDIVLDDLSVKINDLSRNANDLQLSFHTLRSEFSKFEKNQSVETKTLPKNNKLKISLKEKFFYVNNNISIKQIPKTNDVRIGYINKSDNIILNKSTLLSLFNKLPEKFTPDDVKELIKKSPKIRIDNDNLKTPYLIMWFFILIFNKNCKKISGKKDKLRIQKL